MGVSPHLFKFTICFVGSGGQLHQLCDLRPLHSQEHCNGYCKHSLMTVDSSILTVSDHHHHHHGGLSRASRLRFQSLRSFMHAGSSAEVVAPICERPGLQSNPMAGSGKPTFLHALFLEDKKQNSRKNYGAMFSC